MNSIAPKSAEGALVLAAEYTSTKMSEFGRYATLAGTVMLVASLVFGIDPTLPLTLIIVGALAYTCCDQIAQSLGPQVYLLSNEAKELKADASLEKIKETIKGTVKNSASVEFLEKFIDALFVDGLESVEINESRFVATCLHQTRKYFSTNGEILTIPAKIVFEVEESGLLIFDEASAPYVESNFPLIKNRYVWSEVELEEGQVELTALHFFGFLGGTPVLMRHNPDPWIHKILGGESPTINP